MNETLKIYAPLSVAQELFETLEASHLSFEEQHAALEITRSLHSASQHGGLTRIWFNLDEPNDAPIRFRDTQDTVESQPANFDADAN